jgi:hypothetical protein
MCSSTLGARTGRNPTPAVVSAFSLLGDSVVGFKAFALVWLVKTVGFLVPLLLLADSVVGFKGLPVICLQ